MNFEKKKHCRKNNRLIFFLNLIKKEVTFILILQKYEKLDYLYHFKFQTKPEKL